MNTSNTITRAHIDDLIARSTIIDTKVGEKTTVVCLKLPNGYEVVESSGCVDATNYNHETGRKICLERIVNRVWALEGYRLQCAMAEPHEVTDCYIEPRQGEPSPITPERICLRSYAIVPKESVAGRRVMEATTQV